MTETATRRRRKPAEAAPSTEAAAGTAGDGRPLDRSDNAPPSGATQVARDQLRAFIERIERLEEEKSTIADDIKDVYGEAKGTGFDTKILRKVVQLRKQDADERREQEAILDTYLHALGMVELPADYADE